MKTKIINHKRISLMLSYQVMQGVLYVALLLAAACTSARRSVSPLGPAAFKSNAALFAYNGDSVTANDFLYVLEKNNADSLRVMPPEQRSLAIRNYLDLYINFRLKVKAAEDAGIDEQDSFKKELEQYQKQLAKPYLIENRVTEQLVQEAYERLRQEVQASHILIELKENATPADTLGAYQLIDSLRAVALKGISFAMLAEQYSDDPSAASNGGNLGYFTALQMVYPFENAAYETAPGDISKPVRTRFGYHIVKVRDKRPSRGKVKAAHILIRPASAEQEGKTSEAYEKAAQIYEQLKKGANWEEMAERFSDDVSTRSSAGELPYFSAGNMMPDFEEAAFALRKPGDISKPVKTRYGWHIIKLIDHQELAPLSELRPAIESKIERSVRSEVRLQDIINKLKQENNFKPDEESISSAVRSLYITDPEISSPLLNADLFAIQEKNFTVNDFYDFVKQQQGSLSTDSGTAYQLYRQFETRQIMAYEESHLPEKHESYRRLLKEYRDGILLFDIMEQKIWSRASEDAIGLRSFFENHRDNYQWNERIEATIFDAGNEQILENAKKAVRGLKLPLDEKQIESIEKSFNTETPVALQIHQDTYEKGSYRTAAESVIDQIAWKKGEHQQQYNGRIYSIIIHEVLSPKLKDLDEVKGIVIADYQHYLDRQWIAALRQKYPVEVYENVLQQIIASYQF